MSIVSLANMKELLLTFMQVSPCGASNATSSTSPQTALASAETACDLGKAIFVLGPSSSGKTTLCNALAEELQIHPSRYVKEVARHVMRTQGFTRKDTGTYEMQAAIMRAQLQAEIEVLAVRHPQAVEAGDIVLLSDRSAVDPIVYASTAKTIAESTRSRLLHDSAFQANLALYKRSLFSKLFNTLSRSSSVHLFSSRPSSRERVDRG